MAYKLHSINNDRDFFVEDLKTALNIKLFELKAVCSKVILDAYPYHDQVNASLNVDGSPDNTEVKAFIEQNKLIYQTKKSEALAISENTDLDLEQKVAQLDLIKWE